MLLCVRPEMAVAAKRVAAAPARLVRRAGGRGRALVARAAVAVPDKYTKVTPTGERVFVKVAGAEAVTTGGVLLPSEAQKKPTSGDVVSIGPDASELKEGATVLYSKFGIGVTDFRMGDDEYCMLKESDVIGTFPKSGASASDIKDIQPCGDRVLLLVQKAEEQTAGGVLLPEAAKEQPVVGTVVRVGPGKKDEDGELKKVGLASGDKVIYFKYAGDKMQDDEGVDYVVIHETDILGKC